MDLNEKNLRRIIENHCLNAGITFDDFVVLYGPQIIDPEVFDPFFEIPYNDLPEPVKDMRIEMLADILTV